MLLPLAVALTAALAALGPKAIPAILDGVVPQDAPGAAADAEEKRLRGQLERTHDAASCRALAAFYGTSRRADALSTLEACSAAAPRDQELLMAVATTAWDWAYRDPTLRGPAQGAVVERGLHAVDSALALSPEHFEALIYKVLLLRVKATLQQDAGQRQKLVEEAALLQKKALEIKKRQNAP